jgi:hypothetical protein
MVREGRAAVTVLKSRSSLGIELLRDGWPIGGSCEVNAMRLSTNAELVRTCDATVLEKRSESWNLAAMKPRHQQRHRHGRSHNHDDEQHLSHPATRLSSDRVLGVRPPPVPFALGPTDSQILVVEAPPDPQFAINQNLRFDAVGTVRPQDARDGAPALLE